MWNDDIPEFESDEDEPLEITFSKYGLITNTASNIPPVEFDAEVAKQVLETMKKEFERITVANLFLDKLRPPKPELKIEIDHVRDPFPISRSMFFRHAFHGWYTRPYNIVSGMMDEEAHTPPAKPDEFEYIWKDIDEDCGQLPKI